MKRLIPKVILVDESMHPIAVQIGYADWLDIERALGLPASVPSGASSEEASVSSDLNQFSGKMTLREDPLEYQRRVRSEWE